MKKENNEISYYDFIISSSLKNSKNKTNEIQLKLIPESEIKYYTLGSPKKL